MCCGPTSSCCPPGGAQGAAANRARAAAAGGGPAPAALDQSLAPNPVKAGGPAGQDPSCCKPGAACCKPDAACCTPGGSPAGIPLDNFNGAPAPTPASTISGGGPAAASTQAQGLGDLIKRLQQMIARLGQQIGLSFS